MATHTDPEEKEDRRKDGSMTFVKIVWTLYMEFHAGSFSYCNRQGHVEEHCS